MLVLLGLSWDPESRRCHLHRLLHRPELWMTSAITLLIIAPWLCIWRVPVETTVPSPGNVVSLKTGSCLCHVLGVRMGSRSGSHGRCISLLLQSLTLMFTFW